MSKKFKKGDRIYHKHLQQFGTFLEYAIISDEECFVELVNNFGDLEYKCVSVSQLIHACKHMRPDGMCLQGASGNVICEFLTHKCNFYEP